MRPSLMLLPLLCVFLATAPAAEVVVSIRYLHAKGKSHAALFLFTSEGTLIRQLTEPTDSHDVNPAFAPDGQSLVFTSESEKTSKRVLVSLNLADKAAHVISGEPPAWYGSRLIVKPFDDDSETPAADTGGTATTTESYPSKDGAYTIVLKPRKGADASDDERDAFLRVGKKPALLPFTKMPGFVSFWMLRTSSGSPFPLYTQPRIALFDGAHNSTDGTQFYALDLAGQRIVQLSLNGGTIFPWPGHPGFFADCQSRYENLGDGRTVNCNYLDLYDARLQRIRFGQALGRFSGASVFEAGKPAMSIVDAEFAP